MNHRLTKRERNSTDFIISNNQSEHRRKRKQDAKAPSHEIFHKSKKQCNNFVTFIKELYH